MRGYRSGPGYSGRPAIADADDIVGYNPIVWRFTPEESVDKALWNFKTGPVGSSSRQALVDLVNSVRASDHRWSERYATLLLTLLLPELQVA